MHESQKGASEDRSAKDLSAAHCEVSHFAVNGTKNGRTYCLVIEHGGDIMIILVINSGSSSIKYKLFEVAHCRVMASGLAEKIGESNSILTHVYMTVAGEEKNTWRRTGSPITIRACDGSWTS